MSRKTTYMPRILVVEDEPFIRKATLSMLEALNCVPDGVPDGKQALALVTIKRYEIILMDIGLPDMDGLEVTVNIRRQEKEQKWPAAEIFALTAYSPDEVSAQCLAAGMDAVMTKPITFAQLAELVTPQYAA